jgi:hypothetical protein
MVTRLPFLLLLVVHRVANLLARRICAHNSHGTTFAVRRHRDLAAGRDFAGGFVGYRHGVVVNLLIRARIGGATAGNGIVFAVELTGPFGMRRSSVAGSPVGGDLYVVARGLVNNCGVLRRFGSEF